MLNTLTLKFHAIQLSRIGNMGFVSIIEGERVFVKINEIALKVPSKKRKSSKNVMKQVEKDPKRLKIDKVKKMANCFLKFYPKETKARL